MWISSAVSDVTTRCTLPPFLTFSAWTPPLGLPFSTVIVAFSLLGAELEPQPAASTAVAASSAASAARGMRGMGPPASWVVSVSRPAPVDRDRRATGLRRAKRPARGDTTRPRRRRGALVAAARAPAGRRAPPPHRDATGRRAARHRPPAVPPASRHARTPPPSHADDPS